MSRRAHKKNRRFLNVPASKLAQMEMVGLVVIVILITLGMLFMATFALKSEPKKKIFTRKGLSYSTISAVMKATVSEGQDCASQYFGEATPTIGKDIIDDCAKYSETPSYSLYRCIGPISGEAKHSCEFLDEMVTYLLDQTLGTWNKNYVFSSKLVSGAKPREIVSVTKGGCPKYKDRDSSGLFPIQTEEGLVESVLYLCD